MWNDRYREPGYAYGTEPNDFLVESEPLLPRESRVLSLGEGEGRNAVFLARCGHDVHCVDVSEVGLSKASALAAERGVRVSTTLADLSDFDLGISQWNAIVSIWCHLPGPLRERVHRACVDALAPGGVLVLEAYTPAQLAHQTGGPRSADMLYSLAQLESDLAGLRFIVARETERVVHEGRYHEGPSATVQVVAKRDA
jgi:SAM-dependent methyltransferase